MIGSSRASVRHPATHSLYWSSLGVEELLRFTLEQELVDGLIGAIAAGGLGEVNMPSVDLSATLGLPAGTAMIQISTTSADRHPGGVVIGGHL